MVVVWMPEALETLESIRKYIHDNDAPRAAAKLVAKIRDASNCLADHPNAGTIESMLADDSSAYRCFVVTHRYKLIYLIDEETVYVYALYDCRQNPSKVRDLFKRKIY